MKKALLGLILGGISSLGFAESTVKVNFQEKILKEQINDLNECSGIAWVNLNILLNSVDFENKCLVPFQVFNEKKILDSSFLNSDDLLLLQSASAVAYGIIVRNKNENGISVDKGDVEKYYSAPYDVVSTKQMPKIVCAYLDVLYEKMPQYFDDKPTCSDLITQE